MRWAQPGHKMTGIRSSQSRRNEAERGHKEPRQAGPRSSRVQSEGFMVRSLSESRTRVASEWKNNIITLHRNLFGSIFRMLYLERRKIEIVEICKEIYCSGIKYMPIYKQEKPCWTKDHRGQHISKSDL